MSASGFGSGSTGAASPCSSVLNPRRSEFTASAPTIGSAGSGSRAGQSRKARVCEPPMPPWKEMSSSKAQPSSSAGS